MRPDTPHADHAGLAERVAAEQAAVAAGQARVCGASCPCHGGITCVRAEHAHEVDDVVPHVGVGSDGQLVQWAHTEADGPILTQAEMDAEAARSRLEHTRALLASLDLGELRAALAGGSA